MSSRWVEAVEALEYTRARFGRNAWSGIGDANRRSFRRRDGDKADGAARGCEFYGVLRQIGDRLEDQAAIRHDGQARGARDFERDAGILGQGLIDLTDLLDQRREVERARFPAWRRPASISPMRNSVVTVASVRSSSMTASSIMPRNAAAFGRGRLGARQPFAQPGKRRAQIPRDLVAGALHAVEKTADLVEHQIDAPRQPVEIVVRAAYRQALAQSTERESAPPIDAPT